MSRIFFSLTIAICLVAFCIPASGTDLCPTTLSQGGVNKSGSTYTLHDTSAGSAAPR